VVISPDAVTERGRKAFFYEFGKKCRRKGIARYVAFV